MDPNISSSASPSPAPSPSTDPRPSDVSIVQECNRALEFLRGGDHTKALELVESSLSRHLNSTRLLSVRIHILHETASQIRDSAARVEYIKKALVSSSRALALSPNSISFALIHASLLFELAENDDGSYDAVVQECEHGLLIEKPTEPDTAVEKLRKELSKVMEKSKILLGGVDRKRFLEDNARAEVKKAFEALLRKKKEVKKVVSKVDTIGRIRAYWNDTMSAQSKRELLRIGIEEMKAHLDKNKLVMAKKVFTEAVDYAKEAKKWKFWRCCCCGKKSFDGVWEHIRIEHLDSPSERFPGIVLQRPHQWGVEMVETGDWKPVDSVCAAEIMERRSAAFDWHCIDDGERATLIDRIREMLRLFIRYRFLASTHFDMLQELIIELLQKQIPKWALTDHGLDKTLQSVCFLDVPDLKHVLEFLENLASAYGLHCLRDCEESDDQGFWADVRETIVFSGDFSILIFDERLLRGDIVDPDNGNAVVTCGNCAKHWDPNGDIFVDWLWMESPTIREQLQEWEIVRQASTNQALEFFEIFKREDRFYRTMCERKTQYAFYWYELEHVKRMCVEEKRKREQTLGYHLQSYATLFSKRRKEIESNGDVRGGFGLYVTWSILKKAQTDEEIQMEIQKQRDQAARELYLLDAIILAIRAGMQQTRLKLETASVYDYRFIMVPLLKSFMMANLKELVNKDAEEKSNAEIEGLLVEIALDAQKNTDKGERQEPGKSMAKVSELIVVRSSSAENVVMNLIKMLVMKRLQKQIENEDKEKQNRNTGGTSAENVAEDVPVFSFDLEEADFYFTLTEIHKAYRLA